MDEAKQQISLTKAQIKKNDLNMFDWDMTDPDQWIFDTKMMVFLWFKEVAPMVRQKVLDHSATGVKRCVCEGHPRTGCSEETMEQSSSSFL